MRGQRGLLVIAAALAALVALFVFLRPGEEEPAAPPVTTTAPVAPPPSATATSARPRPAPTIVNVTVRGGQVNGGIQHASVREGTRVVLVVRADVSDHVHVHGYDLMRDVAPGRPARIAFRATIPGRFEIELEERGLHIAELRVTP